MTHAAILNMDGGSGLGEMEKGANTAISRLAASLHGADLLKQL